MIKAINGFSNQKTNNKIKNLSKSSSIAFTGGLSKLGKNLTSNTDLNPKSKIGQLGDELSGTINRFFKKILGDRELPTVNKPLTANGEIKHIGPDGQSIFSIKVPDSEIKNPGVDGSNIYKLDSDLPRNDKIAKEAQELIQKEVNNLTPDVEREIDPTKIIFGPDDMPIMDVDGKPITEMSDDVSRIDFDHHRADIDSDEHRVNFDLDDVDDEARRLDLDDSIDDGIQHGADEIDGPDDIDDFDIDDLDIFNGT